MNRTPRPSQRAAKKPSVDPFQDPVGAFLVRQRPEVAPGSQEPPRPIDTAERITDTHTIGALLSSVSNMADGGEDDLIFELLYLETLVAAQPLKSAELLDQLGALGDEVREGLLPPGLINVVALRRRTRRLKQHLGGLASRVTAAMLMLFTSLPLFGQQAVAAESDSSHNTFQIAAAPVVRVIDANSGQGLPGVTIKSMEEKVLGVTDGNGQATLAEEYANTDLMSLEKNGYELSLLERGQLAARNIISMKPLKNDAHLASKPANRPQVKPPVAPHDATAPRMAMDGDHGPHVVAPKPPTAPKAPQIRLPVKPRTVAASKPNAKPVMAALPTKPRPAHMLEGDSGDEAPVLARPHVEAPAAHAPAKPHHVAAHSPAKPAIAHGEPAHSPAKPAIAHGEPAHSPAKPAIAHGEPAHADPMANAARKTAMELPARPRKPVRIAAEPSASEHTPPETIEEAPPREPVAISVPRRVPRASHASYEAAPTGRSGYKVKAGDSLSKLAKRYLGSAKRWPELYAANRGRVADPALIRVGQVLSLPTATASKGTRTYVVRPGDSLFKIAGQQTGDAARWFSIYQMNRGKIQNPRVIFPGQRIYLPV